MITPDNLQLIKTMLVSLKYINNNMKVIEITESGKLKKVEFNKVIYEFKFHGTKHHLYSNKGLTTVINSSNILYNCIGETVVRYNGTEQKYRISFKGIKKEHYLNNIFVIDIDGLDKSVLDWNEDDLLYYTLKNS